jgi:TetR/AcrR family transcriptional regulator
MPLKTFLNLKKERQQEIIDACLEEFSFHDYRDASLTRIIAKLGIAKGSFYRYFESKRDLYRYLIEYAKTHNNRLFNEIFSDSNDDILDSWAKFYLAAVKLDNEFPLFSYFGYKVFQERNNIILGNVALKSKETGIKFLKQLFLEQQKNGKIRKDIDLELMIFTLMQINEGFLDYLTIKHKIDFKENIKNKKPLFPLPEKLLKRDLLDFARLLREGFQPRS